jgi:hypothetical protein
MKHTEGMGSGVMIKIGSVIQILIGETHRQHGEHTRLLFFFS